VYATVDYCCLRACAASPSRTVAVSYSTNLAVQYITVLCCLSAVYTLRECDSHSHSHSHTAMKKQRVDGNITHTTQSQQASAVAMSPAAPLVGAPAVPLKDRICLCSPGASDTIFVRGFTKITPEGEILHLLGEIATPVDIDLSQRHISGAVWAKYVCQAEVQQTILCLHQRQHRGSCLSARYELGVGADGRRVADSSSHNTRIRRIYAKACTKAGTEEQDGLLKPSQGHDTHNYNSESLTVNGVDYPFPSGVYLSRVIFLSRKVPTSDPLLSLITDPSMGNKYSKEVSEVVAMCDAVERAFKFIHRRSAATFSNVRVFVLGDGKKPLCAASLCLHFPSSWKYYSIDPIMSAVDVGPYSNRFFQHNCLSQNFKIPPHFVIENAEEKTSSETGTGNCVIDPPINVVVACHSHAPLKEFLSRVPRPAIVVTMPCCADYSAVDAEPILCFDDFEVYSPKRKVHIYNFSDRGEHG
jgi:hypothetical protein